MNYKPLMVAGMSFVACGLFIYEASQPRQSADALSQTKSESVAHKSAHSSCLCGKKHAKTCVEGLELAMAAKRAEVIKESEKPIGAFKDWLILAAKGELSEEQMEKGVELAKQRREAMLGLMEFAPEQAIADALSWAEYEALADDLKPFVEKPFSGKGDFMMMPICHGAEAGKDIYYKLNLGGQSYDLTAYDRFTGITTKEGMPLQGIQLEGKAALRTNTFQQLDAADQAAVAGEFMVANLDPNVDFYSGKPISGEPVVALGGGQLYYFADLVSLNEFGERLEALDQLNGPEAGSRMLYSAYSEGGAQTDIQSLEIQAQALASDWTTSSKKVLFIIADFPDLDEVTPNPADLESVVNGVVSDKIREMSYGKTWVEADVSQSAITMPNDSTHYAPSKSDDLHADALVAFKTAYPAIDTDQYDIIAVQFTSIGMGDPEVYGGLASIGGSKHWIQGGTYLGGSSAKASTMVHEFGHNYGLSHAHFWETTDNSVVGTGSTDNYGNIYDRMGSGPIEEGHFHPQAKAKLNWLIASDWADVTTSGTYRLYRGDHKDTTGIRGLRVKKDDVAKDYYWVGYRAAYDNQSLQKGVLLNWQKDADDKYSRSWLLDTTPGSVDGRDDSSVTMGRTYSDNTAGVHITPVAIGGSGADKWIEVTVNVGSFPGNVAPTASISGSTSGDARTALTFTAVASDSNGDELAYSWDFGDGKIKANQSSVSHSWSTGGSYTVKVTVSDMKGGTVTKTLGVTISDPLNTWTEISAGNGRNLYCITEGNGKLIAAGKWGTVYSSTDAINWSSVGMGGSDYLYGAAYGGGKYVLVGMDSVNSTWVGVIHSSTNGTTWTQRRSDGPVLRDVKYIDGNFYAVGDEGLILTSTDASTWLPVASGIGSNLNLNSIAYGNGQYVIVGAASNSTQATILTSTDGSSWVNTSSGAGTEQGFFEVEYLNNLFVAGGFYTRIRYSLDGGATFQSNRTSDHERITAFAYGNGVYFAAGTDLDNSSAATSLVSTDGKNWSELSATQMGGNEAVFYNNTFITVHESGEIWQSDPIPALSGVVVWQDGQFSGESENTGLEDDFDGDGVQNIFEYVTGTDPKDPSSHSGPVVTEESGYLTIALGKAPGIDGVSLEVEISKDMVSWDTTGVVIITDDANLLKARVNLPMTDPTVPERFLRIKATVE